MREWLRRDPKRAGFILLAIVAAVLWLTVQRIFAKPLGASCKNDMDCGSFNCLQNVTFGYAGGSGTCTRKCSADADCPMDFACASLELVHARAHEKVSADAPKETAHLCMKR